MTATPNLRPNSFELTLDEIVSPISSQEFVDAYWEKKHVLINRENPDHYGHIFSFADLDQYLSLAARNSAQYLSFGMTTSAGHRQQRLPVKDIPRLDLYNAFHEGATILLESIDRSWAPAAELAKMLSRTLRARVKVNVYMTPPGHQGAPIHPDIQDVFVLQVHGSKNWYVYDERAQEAAEDSLYMQYFTDCKWKEGEEPPLAQQELLEQGGFLYLPRGVVHRAVAPPDTASMHLTVIVSPFYWVDLMKAAVELGSSKYPQFTRGLPHGFERSEEIRAEMKETFSELLEQILHDDTFDRAADVMARASYQFDAASNSGSGILQMLHLNDIDEKTWVCHRAGEVTRVQVGEKVATIHFSSGAMQMPAKVASSLEYVSANERFQVGDLPGLNLKSQLVLVKGLIRKGLLHAEHEAS